MLTKKTVQRILTEFIEACKKAPPSTIKVILFGSVARGDFDLDSDIDILVVTTNIREAKEYFDEVADELFLKFFIPIAITYVDPKRLIQKDSFIQNVLKEGRILWACKKTK